MWVRIYCRVEQEEALQKYEGVWAIYKAKYESFAKFQQLQREMDELHLVSEQSKPPSVVHHSITWIK